MLEKYAKLQVEHRVNHLVLESGTTGEELHFARGECAGIKLFAQIPATEIERLEAEISLLVKEEEETHETSDEN